MNTWTLSLHWSCLIWRCCHLMSDQLQADSVLQSMPLLLHVAYVIVAKDKTPKRGCRWPVVDNPHRSRLILCCPSHSRSSRARAAHQGRRSWGLGGSNPLKYVGRVRICFDSLRMSHSRRVFHAQQQYSRNSQGRRSWGLGGPDPLKICKRVRVCFDPWKCHILSFKTAV